MAALLEQLMGWSGYGPIRRCVVAGQHPNLVSRFQGTGTPRWAGRPCHPGADLSPLVSISLTQKQAQGVESGLFTIPEVVEVHATTGDADLVAKVLAKDTTDFHRINTEILRLEGIVRTSTVMAVLEVMPTRMEALLRRMAGDERPA